jgi:hypothetical protein
MNWEAIGAVGEILGATGVLITLGYLAAQIRQNTHQMKTAALSSVHAGYLLTENNERYIASLMKSQRNETLSAEERAHMVERFVTIMREFERIWHQQQSGVLSRDHFEHLLDLLRWAMSPPEARRMWEQLAPTFAAEFRDVVYSEALADGAPVSAMAKALAALDPEWTDPN